MEQEEEEKKGEGGEDFAYQVSLPQVGMNHSGKFTRDPGTSRAGGMYQKIKMLLLISMFSSLFLIFH